MSAAPEHTEEEQAVEQLAHAVDAFGQAIVRCNEAGITPAAALRAVGVAIPAMAEGMVNATLGAMAAAPSSVENTDG